MKLSFYKYQGTGNDFIMIDNRKDVFDPKNTSLVKQLCHPKFGIGADGLILIETHKDFDFEMIYFNSDGSQSLCGNGSRCAVNFAHFLGMIKHKTRFIAIDGEHEAFIDDRNWVHFKLHDQSFESIEKGEAFGFLHNGSPHYVQLVKEVKALDVFHEGQSIRYNERFKQEGTNVNFLEACGNQSIFVRTYERGVENETLSCGTGVTASAIIAAELLDMTSPVKIEAPGGKLEVSFVKGENAYQNIYLAGPAKEVYKGEIETNVL